MQQADMADSTRQMIFTGGKMDGNAGASRRNVMSAMLVAPFLCAAVVGFDPLTPERHFDDLIRRYRAAGAALSGNPGRSMEEDDRLDRAYVSAGEDIFKTPAPTMRHLLFKLESAWEDDDDPTTWIKEAILADARRLAENGATA